MPPDTAASRTLAVTATILCVFGLAACGEEPTITAYDAPVETRPQALVKHDEKHAKLAQQAHAHAPVASHDAQADDLPEAWELVWTLPEGWSEQAGNSPMRLATFTSPKDDADRELTVILTKLGANAGDLLMNINRWRGQLGLDPITEDKLSTVVSAIENDSAPGILIRLEGEKQHMLVAWFTDRHSNWFFKSTTDPQTLRVHERAFVELIQSVRPKKETDG